MISICMIIIIIIFLGSLTHWGSAEKAHIKHDCVFRRERELSPGDVLPAVQHVAIRVGDLSSETVKGCKQLLGKVG